MDKQYAVDVCKLGEGEECCIFLGVSTEFSCLRTTALGEVLEKRLKAGMTNAKGNAPCLKEKVV